jgi:hypothetical protein
MTAAPILKTRCHYCSRFRHPREIVKIGTGGAKMCWHCWGWHQKVLLMLATGKPPEGCQECGVTFDDLQAASGSGDVRMYIHPKDGIYQVLCRICSDRYVPQRVDLYRATQFGHKRKI